MPAFALLLALLAALLGTIASTNAKTLPPVVDVEQTATDTYRISLAVPDVVITAKSGDGGSEHAVEIAGASIAGEAGAPALPVLGRLLALPAGKGVSVSIVDVIEERRSGVHVAPVPQERDRPGAIDPAAYARSLDAPLASVGEPALLHGVRVVPLTLRPVAYDAEREELVIRTRMTVDFTFTGQDHRNDPAVVERPLPADIAALLARNLVNPPAHVLAAAAGRSGPTSGPMEPGLYLMICPDDAAVIAALEPLLDWRREQGYAVRLATKDEAGSTAAAIKNFIRGIYDAADPPLAHVVLVGDVHGAVTMPCWFENISGFHGEGDHYYTTLEGDDNLGDVLIGRLSVTSPTQLASVVAKIVGYETAPATGDPGWFTRAAVIGDPSYSGITCVYVNQWLKAQLEEVGYAEIDTIFAGNFPGLMLASLNRGLSVFGYRGFGGTSGFTAAHVNYSSNGGELPLAVVLTCLTGSFEMQTEALSEAFLRDANGGGIGAIGLATGGTHTRYNNCMYHGVWEAALNSGTRTLGAALYGGKLEMVRCYEVAEPHVAEIWSVWANLMGDPATPMWQEFPETAVVTHPAQLAVGADALAITVAVTGEPRAGVQVALVKNDEIRAVGLTGEDGRVVLPLGPHTAGTLHVTATGSGLLPYRSSVTLASEAIHLAAVGTDIVDSGGDGMVDPGEILDLTCTLRNLGSEIATDVSATLTAVDPFVTVIDGQDLFADIPSGAEVPGENGFQVMVAPDAPDAHDLRLELTVDAATGTWTSLLELPVVAAELIVTTTTWGGSGEVIDPGEEGTLILSLENIGNRDFEASMAVLRTTSPWVDVTDSLAVLSAIPAAGSGDNSGDPFALAAAHHCYSGHLADFELELRDALGRTRTVPLQLAVGSVATTDPIGPSAYGYYAFDDTDTEYLYAPQYDWVEISPDMGGPGTDVGLTDFGYEQDDTRTVDLPFPFTYHGETFTRLSICSNGWISFGETSLRHYRNYAMPCAGSPDRMVAVFWDNLRQLSYRRVYYWYDAPQHRYIVQWDRLSNYAGGIESFEVILYDPAVYLTSTGDGEIVCQYAEVSNLDTVNGYATVGLQNLDGTDGLLYTYWNEYAPGAATLQEGRAIRFVPYGDGAPATCDVAPSSLEVTLEPGETTTRPLEIINTGELGSLLRWRLERNDPDEPRSAVVKAVGAGDKDLSGSYAEIHPGEYDVGTIADITLNVYNNSTDLEWVVDVELDFPSGVSVVGATNLSVPYGTPLQYNGATGDGAVVRWQNGILYDTHMATGTVTLDFSTTEGLVLIPYTLTGDGYGQPPHFITGVLEIRPDAPYVQIIEPTGGEQWTAGEEREISWQAGGGPTAVIIELSRDSGATWENLATDVPADGGTWTWTVSEPVTAHALVRVSDQNDAMVTSMSHDEFTIARDLSWVEPSAWTGSTVAGEPTVVTLTFDAGEHAEGSYQARLVIEYTAGDAVTVPITMVIDDVTAEEQIPAALALAQNHPNPFNPRTQIAFSLPDTGPVQLVVYDMLGRRVRTLIDGHVTAGHHVVPWDGRDGAGRQVAAGIYLYRLVAESTKLSRKMTLVR